MNKFCLSLFLFGAALVAADEASEYCANGPPGRYCTPDLTGYYECTGRDSYKIQCSATTQCACFVGPNCASVELVGDHAPCQRIEEPPKFPLLLSIYLNATTVDSDRGGDTVFNTQYQLYSDRINGRFRADIVNGSRILESDYYLGESSGNLHYHVLPENSVCLADRQPVPSFSIPAGYRFFNTSTYNGIPANIYYFRAGGQNNGAETVYAQYITTRPDANGFVIPLLNYGFFNDPQFARARRVTNTYLNAVAGPSNELPEFSGETFNPPAYCNATSTGESSSSTTGANSTGSTSTSGNEGSTGTGMENSCSNVGYMRCVGESQYQVCDHGSWQNAQSCQSGLKCEVSGNYIYCV